MAHCSAHHVQIMSKQQDDDIAYPKADKSNSEVIKSTSYHSVIYFQSKSNFISLSLFLLTLHSGLQEKYKNLALKHYLKSLRFSFSLKG